MTELLGIYPDAEDVSTQLLLPVVGNVATAIGTATPDVIPTPYIQVSRLGGADDGLTDHAHVEVACFHSSRTAAWALAMSAQQYMLAARAQEVVQSQNGRHAVVDYSLTITPPEQVPYPDQALYLVVGVYQLSMRRTPPGR